ncbi:helix-loop-helix DNA-binding domain-containing protein [Daldinia decipiens]|uniref:helix-loop-helix DNA-binding domain-containing protein n=1 Tax=Daldinia decipiens TaxID=326647 RepID=UPI0020C44D65|nr:helix-loop-helix DNA-binding domain-containing protein [Daldinia decipiens]KAI1656650.1 helix-loop-helix DNA-binding domain-containing protein [Daldinia decipiens]
MAMMDPSAWNGQDQPMSSAGEDDFQQFLEMGGMSNLEDGLQFDFHDFNGVNGASMMHQPHDDSIDTPMSNSNVPTIIARNDMGPQSQMSPMTSAPSHPGIPTQMMPQHHTSSDAISEIDAQIQFLQQQRLQQQRRQLEEQQRQFREQQAAFYAQQHRNMVPPTPQSLEIQAATQFFASQDQAHSSGMFDGYHQHLKDPQDMAFTPLVSPAVTPLEPHFPVDPGFSQSGPYFSPLTSPALHAQNDSASTFDHRHSGHTTNSPIEMDIEPSLAQSGTANLSKKVRKSNATKARKSNVRQSPITKPQRRKTASTPIINAQVLSELAESAAKSSEHPPQPKSVSAVSTEESENASVSPEALEMPPPPLPLPRSARQSPYIQPQTNGGTAPLVLPTSLGGKPSPATPASLFRISPKSKSADPNNPEHGGSEHIESFELPESVNFSKPDLPLIDTQQPVELSPEVETAKTSTFQSLPSPVLPKPTRSATASATQSPQLTPKSTTPNPRKTPLIAPRGPKKRPSISSVSPALRPKISPSIKPLLPGTPGLSAEDSASRLLTSKSNYQNILEGNTVPGVSYPSELSTNLTSKRTSHKIAEQGRRNRINSALQEIATLLPTNVARELSEGDGEAGSGEKKDGKQSSAPNSKASTVELAIVYIKQLQQEIAEANRRADEAEKKLEEKATAS